MAVTGVKYVTRSAYARALEVALIQNTYSRHEPSEKSTLKELMSMHVLNGVLI